MSGRLGIGIVAVARARREVALEHVVDLGGIDARPLVVDLQLDRLAVGRQCHDDRAAARREADGILQHVLHHNLEHAVAGAHHRAFVEAANEANVLAGEYLAEMKRSIADELGEISRNAGRFDEVGGADVVTLGGDHEVEQAGQRGIDDLERAPGTLIVAGHGAANRFQRRADGGERRLEGMRLVLRRLADLLRHAPQFMDQLVEVAGHAREFGHDVAVGEGVVADAALADLGGDLAEAAQAEADADGHQKGNHRQHEVDRRGHADLARLPVGPADRGVEEFGGGVGGRQDPASRGGPDRE